MGATARADTSPPVYTHRMEFKRYRRDAGEKGRAAATDADGSPKDEWNQRRTSAQMMLTKNIATQITSAVPTTKPPAWGR